MRFGSRDALCLLLRFLVASGDARSTLVGISRHVSHSQARISPAARMRCYRAKRSASAKRPRMDGTLADQRRRELNTRRFVVAGEETQGAVMNPNEQKPGQQHQGGQQGGQGGQQGGGGQPKPGQQGQEPGQGGQHGGQQKPGQGGQGGQR